MKLEPTAEQRNVIDAFKTGKDVTISAGAGCGKSSTLEMLAESTSQRGLLIAFNRAVAEEASRKLSSTNTTALNTHRIAYRWARGDKDGSVALDKLNSSKRISWFQVASAFQIQPFVYGDKSFRKRLEKKNVTNAATSALDNFLKSGDDQIAAKHMPYIRGLEAPEVYGRGPVHEELSKVVIPLAQRMWKNILSPNASDMRVTHDVYLKLWALSKPDLGYDFILLDEAQDTNPAVMSVFENQPMQKIAVGDKNQQLYQFTGSINAMDEFKSDLHVKLQQSWRFGAAIQDAANVFLDRLNADIRLKGNPNVESRVVENAPFDPHASSATLVRTNAGAIQELISALDSQQRVFLIGGNTQFKTLIKAAGDLRDGRSVSHPDFAGFSNWTEAVEYANEDGGADLKVIVDLIEKHGSNTLLNALDKCVGREQDAQKVISTVHKVKGREWDQVRLADDFQRSKKKKDKEDLSTKGAREALMFYYVAVTRAKHLLDPGPLAPDLANVNSPSESVKLSLPEDVREKLDSARGDMSMDDYILSLIKKDQEE